MKTPADIDRGFLERASDALSQLGVTGMEFLRQHPDCSKIQLAKTIGSGVTARGLTMVLFQEARQQSSLRALVQDLLYRKLLQEFPDGWCDEGNVRPTVKLGSWHYEVVEFAPECEDMATTILRSLATTDEPEAGWKPSSQDDARLRWLFDKYWSNCV